MDARTPNCTWGGGGVKQRGREGETRGQHSVISRQSTRQADFQGGIGTTRSNAAEKSIVLPTGTDLLFGVTPFPTTLNHQQLENEQNKSYVFADTSPPVGTGQVTDYPPSKRIRLSDHQGNCLCGEISIINVKSIHFSSEQSHMEAIHEPVI